MLPYQNKANWAEQEELLQGEKESMSTLSTHLEEQLKLLRQEHVIVQQKLEKDTDRLLQEKHQLTEVLVRIIGINCINWLIYFIFLFCFRMLKGRVAVQITKLGPYRRPISNERSLNCSQSSVLLKNHQRKEINVAWNWKPSRRNISPRKSVSRF